MEIPMVPPSMKPHHPRYTGHCPQFRYLPNVHICPLPVVKVPPRKRRPRKVPIMPTRTLGLQIGDPPGLEKEEEKIQNLVRQAQEALEQFENVANIDHEAMREYLRLVAMMHRPWVYLDLDAEREPEEDLYAGLSPECLAILRFIPLPITPKKVFKIYDELC